MATQLVGVTLALPRLAAHIETYSSIFGWKLAATGPVSGDQASDWRAPALAGALGAVFETGGAWVRMVDQDVPVPSPYSTLGWAGAEVLVADLDALVARLPINEFQRLAEPSALSINPDIRFCPVTGPAGELWLLTEVRNRAFGVESAVRPVERPFLITGGTHDLAAEAALWASLGLEAANLQVAMPGLSATHGLPADAPHAMMLVTLDGASFIENAHYPDAVVNRDVPEGALPPGLAIVTISAGGGIRQSMIWSASGLHVEVTNA